MTAEGPTASGGSGSRSVDAEATVTVAVHPLFVDEDRPTSADGSVRLALRLSAASGATTVGEVIERLEATYAVQLSDASGGLLPGRAVAVNGELAPSLDGPIDVSDDVEVRLLPAFTGG